MICEPDPCNCVCHKLGYVSHCEHCRKPPVSEAETVHLQAPKTSENEGVDVYCPVKKEFTHLGMGKSADGLETYACLACREPEPTLRDVTQADLDALAERLDKNE